MTNSTPRYDIQQLAELVRDAAESTFAGYSIESAYMIDALVDEFKQKLDKALDGMELQAVKPMTWRACIYCNAAIRWDDEPNPQCKPRCV